MRVDTPKCPYCGQKAELVTGREVYPHRPDLSKLSFWQCAPCDARVGCHAAGNGFGDGTRPLGRLATEELRSLKGEVHAMFDPLWKSGGMTRGQAYRRLGKHLKLREAHIGEFDEDTCRRALEVLKHMKP